MNYIFFSLILWSSIGAGALSISFPPNGTPTAALESQMISWTRDRSDPPDKFAIVQKIQIDNEDGPSPKSTPVPIMNSQGNNGTSPFFFDVAGSYEILAIDMEFEEKFFSTEVDVVTNPTSSLASPVSSGLSSTASTASSFQSVSLSASSLAQFTGHSNGSQTTKTPTLITTSPPSITHSALSQGSSSNEPSHTGAIIGGVVGGVVFLIGANLLFLYLRSRRRRATVAFNALLASPFQEATSLKDRTSLGGTEPIIPATLNSRRRGDTHRILLPQSRPMLNENVRIIRNNRDELSAEIPDDVQHAGISDGSLIAHRHQDSGWRDPTELRNGRNQPEGREVAELPPNYSEV